MNKKLVKRLSKKELETKKLKKQWRELGYDKFMPFGNFRILASKRKDLK
jgi:hypothetical protein